MNYIKNCKYIILIIFGLLFGTNIKVLPATATNSSKVVVINPDGQTSTQVLDSNEHDGNDSFKANDKAGIVMAITVLGIIFTVFIVLYLLSNLIGSTAVSLSHKRAMKIGMSKEEAKGISRQSGEVFAAIAMAIYEATELHDDENAILTIKNTVRNYSPWSSKIYSLRETPKK